MTIQDFMVQQLPYKQKAEIAFQKGDYNQAAESILEFAEACGKAEDFFDSTDSKTIQAQVIGFNTAALMLCKILELTAPQIKDPIKDNPYQTRKTLDDDPNVPEIVAQTALDICYFAVIYSDIMYDIEPSIQYSMGLLVSMAQLAKVGIYYHIFDTVIIKDIDKIIDKCNAIAKTLVFNHIDNTKIVNVVKNYYMLVAQFCGHFAIVSNNVNEFLNWNQRECILKSEVTFINWKVSDR